MATNNQGLRQASVRAVTGTTLPYNGDWHALFDAAGIAAGPFNGRLLAWINDRLGTSYTEINGAMNAFAVAQGFPSWNAMGTFDAGGFEGILDQLSTAPVAAWSVARVLKTDWLENALIRLRRASDNAESDFGADTETGLLDTAAIATWIGVSSAFVVKVYDQSGNAADWAQTTAGDQPPYSATALNGKPGWAGSSDWIGCGAAAVDNIWTGGGSLHLVWGITTDPVNDKFLWKGFGGSGGWDFVGSGTAAPNTKAQLRVAAATSGFIAPTSGTARVSGGFYAETIAVGSGFSTAATSWRANGAAETLTSGDVSPVGAPQDDSGADLMMPLNFSSSINPIGGEMILFDAALSSGDLQTLNDDATDFYGV